MRDESRNVSLRGRRQLSHPRVREVMVVVAGISIYVTGVAYCFLPDLVSSGVAIAAVVCVLMTVALTRTRIKMPPLAPTAVLFIALMLFVPDAIMRKTFGDTDIGAFIFHLRNGIAGTPISDYFPQIIATALSLASIMVSIAAFGSAVKTRGGILFIAAGVLFLVNPMTSRSIVVLADNYLPSPLLKKIVDPVVALPSSVLPDIFVIFLEGTDMRFSDRAVYGNSFEHIEALKSEALTLSSIGQLYGTGYSVAGMVTSLCGIPPVLPPHEYILANTQCLGDILRDFGYVREFFVGGNKEFGGIRLFYERHGDFRLTGIEELRELGPPVFMDSAVVSEIADDEAVFSAALHRHAQIASIPQPLAMVVETSGPHGVPSYLSRSCSGTGQAETTEDAGMSVRCTTGLALSFIRTVQQRQAALRPDRPLRIIVVSDHLNHAAERLPAWEGIKGRNTVLLAGDPAYDGRVIDRVGTFADVYATVLDWLGFAQRPVAAGIGRSLLSQPDTLAENIGLQKEDLQDLSERSVYLKMLGAFDPVPRWSQRQR